MATYDAFLSPKTLRGTKIAALAASASSAEQEVGTYGIFAIVGTDKFTIRFGATGMGAADATDFLIPANTVVTLSLGRVATHFRVFNPTAAAIDVHWLELSKTV